MIAFTLLGGLTVYTFPLILGISVTLGLAWSCMDVKAKEVRSLMDAGISGLVGGLLFGRAAYVASHWFYFREHWTETFQLQLGGLSWVGAVFGSLLALGVYARVRRQPWTGLIDKLLPMATIIAIGVWLACWVDGIAYGQAIASPRPDGLRAVGWWAFPAPDEWGALAPRVPVQFLGAVLSLGLFWLVDQWPQLRTSGNPAWPALIWMAGFSFIMLGVSWLRMDPAPLWAGIRPDVWGGLLLSAASILFLSIFSLTQKGIRDKG